MKMPSRLINFGPLPVIVLALILSGSLRLGGIGLANATEPEETPPEPQSAALDPAQTQDPDVAALLALVQARSKQLDAKEAELAARASDLAAAQELIETNMRKLEQAEAKLASTISKVDGASEADLERLTAVYQAMKPKVAAPLFEQMTPEFAAGFLGRMAPQAAAGIMSGLSTDAGYAISVVLAGRNAKAPSQ